MEVATSAGDVKLGKVQLQTNLQAAALVKQKEVAEEQGEHVVRLIDTAAVLGRSTGQLLDIRV